MAQSTSDRMRAAPHRRRPDGTHETRLTMPDAGSSEVRARVAVAGLDPVDEEDALRWIEAVSEFDEFDENETG